MKNRLLILCLFIAYGLQPRFAWANVYPLTVEDFDVVKLNVPAHVLWSDDDAPACVLDCSPETKENIEVVQEGKSITIRWKSKNFTWLDKTGRLLIKLQSSSLKQVSVNGSGEFVMKNTNDSDEFEFSINGSGDFKGMIAAKNCKGSINGSGDAQLGGVSGFLSLTINGSGDMKAFGLKAKEVEVKISGSGDAEVQPTEKLDVRIAGSGDVKYKGDPKSVVNKVSGSGSIKKV